MLQGFRIEDMDAGRTRIKLDRVAPITYLRLAIPVIKMELLRNGVQRFADNFFRDIDHIPVCSCPGCDQQLTRCGRLNFNPRIVASTGMLRPEYGQSSQV